MDRMRSIVSLVLLGLAISVSEASARTVQAGWDRGLQTANRFKVIYDGAAVLDQETGLVWSRHPGTSPASWGVAVATCLSSTVGNRRGWRLPRADELQSLMDTSQSDLPLTPGHPFVNVKTSNGSSFWSATDVRVRLSLLLGTPIRCAGKPTRSRLNVRWEGHRSSRPRSFLPRGRRPHPARVRPDVCLTARSRGALGRASGSSGRKVANVRRGDMPGNGDTKRAFTVGTDTVRGLGSFHKTLHHNKYGEVRPKDFDLLVAAAEGDGSGFAGVLQGTGMAAALTNPQAGLAHDQLTRHPAAYSMPPAPTVLSLTTAAEMTELYWMALLRDVSFDGFAGDADVATAAAEVDQRFGEAVADSGDAGHLTTGIDVPGAAGKLAKITPQNLFRLGLPGDEVGPMVSQFFVRDIHFGTQGIDQKQRPYRKGRDYLCDFKSWMHAQNSGRDRNGQAYPKANEDSADNYEPKRRYISTMRDLARFVNKDALHQAYFNAALLLLSGGALWTLGNPYRDGTGDGIVGRLGEREAGFGVLGGPHILALVSEVASRALKIVWNQKWQVHLRLRPEAYGGLVHVQTIGIGGAGGTRPYGLPAWVATTTAAGRVKSANSGTLLLPMAFTPGSPTHPSYGAGHATVAGCCVTVLKAYFKTFTTDKLGNDVPIKFSTLMERAEPWGPGAPISCYVTGVAVSPGSDDEGVRTALPAAEAKELTIEGELNKLASNVAMGRSIGGVHWRTDNTRSLVLGEAIAAQILADITTDVNEFPTFEFRTFTRRSDGKPKKVQIGQGRIFVDGTLVDTSSSAL